MTQIERVAMSLCATEDTGVPCDEPCKTCLRQAKNAIKAMWTPFDAEDESTWPDIDDHVYFVWWKVDGKGMRLWKKDDPEDWDKISHYYDIGPPQEITGAG